MVDCSTFSMVPLIVSVSSVASDPIEVVTASATTLPILLSMASMASFTSETDAKKVGNSSTFTLAYPQPLTMRSGRVTYQFKVEHNSKHSVHVVICFTFIV